MRFRADPSAITGSIAPVVTPFTRRRRRRPRQPAPARRWQLTRARTASRSAAPPASRAPRPSSERVAAMRTVAEEVGDRVPFLPGTGSAKLDETLELTAAARDLGADAALVITPYYARPTQEALFRWYARVAAEFPDLPIVDLQRADPHRGRHRARDRRPAAPRLRQHRRRSRRRPRTSSTSPACCTCAGATSSSGRASSCSACRCWPSVASASSARWPTSRRGRWRDMYEPGVAGDHGHGPRPALRAAPARRPAVRRDQPGTEQVGAEPSRADRLGLRAAAARRADARRGSPDRSSGCGPQSPPISSDGADRASAADDPRPSSTRGRPSRARCPRSHRATTSMASR